MREAGIELMERLNPAYMLLLSTTSKLITAIPIVINWVKEYWRTIVTVTVAVTAYGIAVKTATVRMKNLHLWTKAVTAVSVGLHAVFGVLKKASIALSGVTFLLTGNVKKATQAFKYFSRMVKVSPLGLVVTLATAAATALLTFGIEANEAGKAMKDFKKQSADALGELRLMYTSILAANTGTQNRIDLIKEFNSKYGGYLTNLLDEKATIDEITTAYNEATAAIKAKIAQEIVSSRTSKIQSEGIEKQADTLEDISKILGGIYTGSAVNKYKGVITSFVDQQIALGKSTDQIAVGLQRGLLKIPYMTSETVDKMRPHLYDYIKEVKHTADEVKSVRDKFSSFLPEQKKVGKPTNELEEVVIVANKKVATTTVTSVDAETPDETSSIVDNPAIIAENQRYYDELSDLKKLYIESDMLSSEEYKDFAVDAERQHIERLLEIANIEPEKRRQLQDKLYDMMIESKEKCAALDAEEKAQALERDEKQAKEQEDITKRKLDVIQGYAQQFGVMVAQMLTDDSKNFGEFLKEMVKMLLTAVEQMMITYIAKSTMDSIAGSPSIVLGLAKAAAKTALITAAFETAKAAIGGFELGGFTPHGAPDEPQGIVHSNEFVANRYAVSNPLVRPVLNLIDTAQRNNTIGSLSASDVSSVLPSTTSSTTPNGESAAELMAMIMAMGKTIDRLNKRLDEPFVTVNSVTGKGGIKEAMDEYNKINKNKAR